MNARFPRTRTGLASLALGAALAASAPALAAGATLPPNGPKPAGATFSVLPIAGIRGSSVTFTGNRCAFDGAGGTVSLLVAADSDIPVPDTDAKPDGTWSVTVTVPAGARTGRHQVLAKCSNAGQTAAWLYDEAEYFVATPGQTPEVQVSDTTVARGSTITVRGTGCLINGTVPGHPVVLDVFEGPANGRRTDAAVDSDGSWQTEITVPTSTKLGSHPVGAHCLVPGTSSIEVFYIPASITVVAQSTEPAPGADLPHVVRATPRFTG